MKILVTGGAGFIGSAVIRHLLKDTDHEVINLDKLTYAGNLASLEEVLPTDRYTFCQTDICDLHAVKKVFEELKPDRVMHLAAESHVDRSIDGPAEFIQTNVMGTCNLLEVSRVAWKSRAEDAIPFLFHHVSTDEVYGDLGTTTDLFTEETAYDPSSPYSASKASSDHLVRAWQRTYGLPVVITNCSNNYGPYHFPEKLIPHMILNALKGKALPVYGDGNQIRDWLYVEDHARALAMVATGDRVGETYNIGGHNEKRNLEVVQTICDILEELAPDTPFARSSDNQDGYRSLITYVKDRPGHDLRYAIDSSKIQRDLGWIPRENFNSGIRKTVQWYLDNSHWWQAVLDGSYKLERLGH